MPRLCILWAGLHKNVTWKHNGVFKIYVFKMPRYCYPRFLYLADVTFLTISPVAGACARWTLVYVCSVPAVEAEIIFSQREPMRLHTHDLQHEKKRQRTKVGRLLGFVNGGTTAACIQGTYPFMLSQGL